MKIVNIKLLETDHFGNNLSLELVMSLFEKTSAAVRSTDNTSTSLARKLKLLLDIKYFASKILCNFTLRSLLQTF